MKLVWSKRSKADLERQVTWIAKDNPMAAARVVTAIEDAAQILRTFPRTGKPTHNPYVDVLVEGRYGYKIVCQISMKADLTRIMRVFHPRQNGP